MNIAAEIAAIEASLTRLADREQAVNARKYLSSDLEFVGPRTSRISGVTIREAVKNLPAVHHESLMAAYRAR